MSDPQFPKADPATPEFWEARYAAHVTPWDAGGVPAELAGFAARTQAPARTLIPGCGSAHELRHLVDLGWDALAIDFSPAAVAAARSNLGPAYEARVVEGDFFGPAIAENSFDFIYERAFLCALPRRLWPDWAARCADLLRAGGRVGGFFYFDAGARGPPFGLKPGEQEALLAPHFSLVEERDPADSVPVFKGKEKWQVWRKRLA